jgi:anti-sigma-K factor RskA
MPKESFHDDFESQVRLLEPQSDEELPFQRLHSRKTSTTWTLYRKLEDLSLWRTTYLVLVHIALLAIGIAFFQEHKMSKLANEGYEGFCESFKIISTFAKY